MKRKRLVPTSFVVSEDSLELHEAAHAVAAIRLLGPGAVIRAYVRSRGSARVFRSLDEMANAEPVGMVDLTPDPREGEEFDPRSLPEDVLGRMRARLIEAIAGSYGAALTGDPWVRPHGRDEDQAMQAALFLAGGRPGRARDIYQQALPEAKRFVREHEADIRLVAAALKEKRELTGAEIASLMTP